MSYIIYWSNTKMQDGTTFLFISLGIAVLVSAWIVYQLGEKEGDQAAERHFRQADPPPIEECSLIQQIYIPWSAYPRRLKPTHYQPVLAEYLFRACWNVTTANCVNAKGTFEPPDPVKFWMPLKPFSGPRLYAIFLWCPDSGTAIFVFSGTAWKLDWERNLQYTQVFPLGLTNVSPATRCHLGFYGMYTTIREQVWECLEMVRDLKKVIITGYSLGGALATIAAMDLMAYKPLVYTFGSPRVFNPDGAKLLDSGVKDFWRVFNTEDVISDLPPSVAGDKPWEIPPPPSDVIYSHCGKIIAWTDSRGDWVQNHSEAYQKFIFADHTKLRDGLEEGRYLENGFL
jgi:hypothetical protein